MKNKFKLIIVLFFFFAVLNVAFANDVNSIVSESANDDFNYTQVKQDKLYLDNSSDDFKNAAEKTQPKVSINSNSFKSKDTINIKLTDSKGTALKFKNLTATINNRNFKLLTNSKGVANLNINLAKGIYKLTIKTFEDDKLTPVSRTFNIKVSQLSTSFIYFSNFVLNKNYFYSFLKDENGEAVFFKKVTLNLNGKTYERKTNKYGRIAVYIKSSSKKLNLIYRFSADNYYKSSSKKVSFYVNQHTSLSIGNSKLITGGYLRVYLKDVMFSKYWNKLITLTVGKLKFFKKTNADGVVVVKPNMPVGKYKVSVRCGKLFTYKFMNCLKGNVKDPLKEIIPLISGAPDIDVMPGNYIWGDGGRTYILTKAQYQEVLKRDSYCLFLKNKLTKYTFFKTKIYPNTYHLINREKWNVIEKEIYQELVDANSYTYWPSFVKASLKGRSYSYPEVRDWQDTSYTCGPTACSMCSQVLKNYLCEKFIAIYAGTTKADGTACSGMVRALEMKNFKCDYYYRNSFSYALNELKKGGCALVFHAKNHYVAILDISKDGKKVLVSNSLGTYDNIASGWLSVGYMKTRYYKNYDDGLIVRLNYKLHEKTKNQIGCYYSNFVPNWVAHNNAEIVS